MRRYVQVAILLLATHSAFAQPAIVTLCSDAEQLGGGVNLRTALSQGTKITFRCPGRVTIAVLRTLQVTRSTEIDGGGTITLDALQGARMFRVVSPNSVLRIVAITLTRGRPDAVVTGPNYSHASGTAGGVVLSTVAN